MTTNQTIDGVPLLPCPFCGGEPYGTHDHYVHDDLSPMPCVECRACSAHLKAEDWNRRAEPAAQPQGEPVALLSKGFTTLETRDGKYRIITQYKNRDDAWSDYTALCKAEQSAPVAVVLPERREPTQDNPYLSDADHEWNAYRDELKRLNPSL